MVAKKAVAPVKQKSRLLRYFDDVKAEVRKVVWPSRRQTLNLTAIVLGVTAAMSVFLGAIDWIFAQVVRLVVTAF
jgi:preprotein translocase subunit SecE